jgi:DEAD/DEAH box helicase domain-containing protein
VIIDTTPDRPRVIGETDLFSAQVLVHTQAIYLHESAQYHVDKLDWGERKAYVRRVDVDYYTYANRAVTLKPLDVFDSADATGGRRAHGEVMVASLVTLFKKLKFGTDENVGWGPIDLPELELQTTAYWLTAEGDGSSTEAVSRLERKAPGSRAGERTSRYVSRPSAPGNAAIAADHGLAGWRKDDLDVALLGVGRAIQAVASVLLMVDPRDLGLVTQVRSPHSEAPTIYLYEAVPGGIGLSERLFKRHDELIVGARALIQECACESGCPACTGPRLDPAVDGKALALRLLAQLDGRTAKAAARGVARSAGSAHGQERPLAEPDRGRLALDDPAGPRPDSVTVG